MLEVLLQRVLGSTAVLVVSQATRLGKGSSVTARDERMS